MKKVAPSTYKNRYGDEFTFTIQEDGNVMMTGPFKYMRYGWSNVYTDAYNAYVADLQEGEEAMAVEEFKKAVHEWADEGGQTEFAKRYSKLVYSDTSRITMIDPSGGPYLTAGMPANYVHQDAGAGTVVEFKSSEEGYLIVIE